MISKFRLYEQFTEDSIKLAHILTTLFANIDPKKDINYFTNYVRNLRQTDNPFVKKAVIDFKKKIQTDGRVMNKQELINQVDSTPILTRKNDEVFNQLFRYAKQQSNHNDPSSFAINFEQNNDSIIFLSKDASYNEIMHELFHLVKDEIVNRTVKNVFNFNYGIQQQNLLFSKLTNGEYKITRASFDKKYLRDPREIYSRINNLKMFLFQHNFVRNPNDDIPVDVINKLYNGEVYGSLNDEDKELFRSADFMDILVFLDLNKFGIKQLNEGNIFNRSNISKDNIKDIINFIQTNLEQYSKDIVDKFMTVSKNPEINHQFEEVMKELYTVKYLKRKVNKNDLYVEFEIRLKPHMKMVIEQTFEISFDDLLEEISEKIRTKYVCEVTNGTKYDVDEQIVYFNMRNLFDEIVAINKDFDIFEDG